MRRPPGCATRTQEPGRRLGSRRRPDHRPGAQAGGRAGRLPVPPAGVRGRTMSRLPFPSLHVTGGLLAADLFGRVLDDADLAGRDPADYGLPPHESVREAASRAFDYLGSTWQAFARERDRAIAEGRPMAGLTRDRWLLSLFRELAYGMLPTTPAGGIVVEDRSFKVSHLYGHVP